MYSDQPIHPPNNPRLSHVPPGAPVSSTGEWASVQPVPAAPPIYISMAPQGSGLGVGMHILHGTLTVCSAGLWAPVWILHALSAKRRAMGR